MVQGRYFSALVDFDFSKAFDYVVRNNLCHKFVKDGLRGKLFYPINICVMLLNIVLNIIIR